MSTAYEIEEIPVVEFHMMDKRKYFPLSVVSGFTIRTILYPVTLIKTRLQIQKHNSMYKGTYDAFMKIRIQEGWRGLYKGFWTSNLMMISQLSYISTYEGVRHYLAENTPLTNNKIRSFIAGGCASMVGQTSVVPIDIVTQHLQLLGKSSGPMMKIKEPLKLPEEAFRSRLQTVKAIVNAVYKRDGIRGFYKGYMASLAVYAPNSAMWWFFYDIYCGMLAGIAPVWVPRLLLQCIAAPIGGVSTTLITTPMDAIRARIQVENTKFFETAKLLWHEERFWIFTKGLSARLIQSLIFSFCIILGYETIKRWSLLEEYKKDVRW